MMVRSNRLKNCPECGSIDLILDDSVGELVCARCGFVITSTLLDKGPEWRAFDAEQRERRQRVGAPLTWVFHDKGLSTNIGWHDRDAYGRKLKPIQKARVYRLRKWQRRTKVYGSTERNLSYALSELTKLTYKLNLPKNVLETASVIYRRVVKQHLIRGRSILGVAAATIYMACRHCNILRSLEETANAANIPKKECARNYRYLLKKLGVDVPPVDSHKYISKIVNHLTLAGETEHIATNILKQATELRLTSGRGPSGIAAACTYIASILTGELRTQGEIAKTVNVTEVTIRNRYKELARELYISVKL